MGQYIDGGGMSELFLAEVYGITELDVREFEDLIESLDSVGSDITCRFTQKCLEKDLD
jgi:hypothetical protein